MAPPLHPANLIARVNRDVERSLLRARNGLRYVAGTHRPKLGATPKDVVWRRGRAQLWRYRRGPAVRYAPPVVIVHSLVSRSYILDLRPGSSMVEYLVNAGLDVFMLDWGVPDELDADNGLATYVDDYLPRALAAVRRETGCREVTLAGYCLGGLMAALYAAGRDDAAVRNLVLMATPIDFDEMGSMVAALREGRLSAEDLIDATGNVKSMSNAMNYCAFSGRLVFVGITQEALALPHPLMHRRELTVMGSRNAVPDTVRRVIAAITAGKIDTTPWVTHTAPFDGFIEAFPAWTRPETGVIKAMVTVQ